jgi:hypothetical protein
MWGSGMLMWINVKSGASARLVPPHGAAPRASSDCSTDLLSMLSPRDDACHAGMILFLRPHSPSGSLVPCFPE